MSGEADRSIFGFHENIILTKNGVWLSNDEEITHEGTLLAFSRNIYRSADGYEIRIGNEKKRIHIEDTFYFITQVDGSPELGFTIRTNDLRVGELDPETLQYKPGRLICKIPDPKTNLMEEAKFLSAAYYEILKFLEKDEQGFFITIEGKKIRLG